MSALWESITLGEHFLRGAEQYGDRVALSDGAQQVTYRQLAELAEADRERLRQAGVQPHELVIMQMSNGIPFVQMFLALMLEEVVPILMLPNHGVRELSGIQSKVHCRFHLTDAGIQHFAGMTQVAYVAPEPVVKAQSPDERIAILLLSGEHSLQRAERLRHFAAQVFEIIVGDAHALHHVVHRLDAERTRAFQAQTFVDGISVFDLRDEDHGKIFLAF